MLADTRQAVGMYGRFLDGADPNYDDDLQEGAASMSGIQKADVEAAMDECDAMGVDAFMDEYGYSWNNLRYWVERGAKSYPSKAIYGVAHRFLDKGAALGNDECNGTTARKKLASLGFTIVEQSGQPANLRGRTSHSSELEVTPLPTNLILYGPPGTGKTYNTALEAVKLCDGVEDYPHHTALGAPALAIKYRMAEGGERLKVASIDITKSAAEVIESLREVINQDLCERQL